MAKKVKNFSREVRFMMTDKQFRRLEKEAENCGLLVGPCARSLILQSLNRDENMAGIFAKMVTKDPSLLETINKAVSSEVNSKDNSYPLEMQREITKNLNNGFAVFCPGEDDELIRVDSARVKRGFLEVQNFDSGKWFSASAFFVEPDIESEN